MYLEHILVLSKTPQENFQKLETLLTALECEKLTLNSQKCKLRALAALGFELSKGGVQLGKEKCLAMKQFERTKVVKQISQLMELAGNFTHFLMNYA